MEVNLHGNPSPVRETRCPKATLMPFIVAERTVMSPRGSTPGCLKVMTKPHESSLRSVLWENNLPHEVQDRLSRD